ncbi:hypothetical protein BML2537_08870 [Providencia stuartii]|uniref:Uncharacterized protein n=1 Tax=Providencia stuartii ATCC 25827 TaxID=471874 RepID=A0AA86YMK7_PROST|nr:hypothetical protein PROSTU_01186 [Providencia stuartii ATCC 25827]BBV07393.1 hypothetical protein BML2537_08870 [Providencia stuartii]
MNTIISQYVSFKESNDYKDDFICRIESPLPPMRYIDSEKALDEANCTLGFINEEKI